MAAEERRRVVGELKRGRESAERLREELGKRSGDGGSLAEEVVASFSRALAALEEAEAAELCQEVSSLSSIDMKSTTKKKKKKPRVDGKRTLLPQRVVTSPTVEDGETWRKYGEKPIQGAAFPRNYYKCSHRQGLGCQATRRVQKMEDNPASFMITYIGRHTCKDAAGEDGGDPFLIRFGSTGDVVGEDDTAACSDIFPLAEFSPEPEMAAAQLDDVFNFDAVPFIYE